MGDDSIDFRFRAIRAPSAWLTTTAANSSTREERASSRSGFWLAHASSTR